MKNLDPIARARRRVHDKKEFLKHGIIFGVFHFALFMAVLFLGLSLRVFLISFLAWGVFGLLLHYLLQIGIPGVRLFDTKWERREIERELSKLKKDSEEITQYEQGESLKLKELLGQKHAKE